MKRWNLDYLNTNNFKFPELEQNLVFMNLFYSY